MTFEYVNPPRIAGSSITSSPSRTLYRYRTVQHGSCPFSSFSHPSPPPLSPSQPTPSSPHPRVNPRGSCKARRPRPRGPPEGARDGRAKNMPNICTPGACTCIGSHSRLQDGQQQQQQHLRNPLRFAQASRPILRRRRAVATPTPFSQTERLPKHLLLSQPPGTTAWKEGTF